MNATIVSRVWSFCTTLRDDESAAVLLERIQAEDSLHNQKTKKTLSRSARNE